MKPKTTSGRRTTTCILAVVLLAVGATATADAQTALQAQLILRPLTPGEISSYGVPASVEKSAGSGPGGITVVPVGEPAYLEAQVSLAIPTSNTVSVSWTLTNTPLGSIATLQESPLGTNVPIFEPADRLVYQVAGRKLLRPDIEGQFIVAATITVSDGTTTNISLSMTASRYVGVDTCALCHSGGQIAVDQYSYWIKTPHASIFTKGIDGNLGIGAFYSQSCLQCHTVGYDTNTNAVNGGFDDVAAQLGWTFPTVITNGNWANMQAHYPALANLANVQCESCHGPGSQHAYSLGNVNLISINYGSGNCAQCHDEPSHHIKNAEWENSKHAITTRDPAGNASCVGCHTAPGFLGETDTNAPSMTTYVPINCITCHDGHDASITNQLRAWNPPTLMDGTTITNGGMGGLCMQCHHARQNAATYAATAAASPYFGPHHGPQADMIEGANGFTYGQAIPSSAHRTAVGDTCVTCHMQAETVGTNVPSSYQVGGHTFKVSWSSGTNAVQMTAACQNCHGPQVTSFDFPLQDYDGDGVIDGVQTEVQHLMDNLSTLLPPIGQVKSSLSINSTWTRPQLEAGYNWLFVNNDGSRGIHNTAYAVGLLKASIANLTGVTVPGGLPDAWVIQYFGTVGNPNGAPNATPAGDGVPNWVKYALGLDPTKPGISIPGGVVWANGKNLVNPIINPGATNTVAIYTAAEIAFNTQAGQSYQIQSISSLSGGWQNVGTQIAGTGSPISYVTPTRNNLQMFFRVVQTP